MTQAEVALTRKESAHHMLQEIMELTPMTKTIKQYKTYFGLWVTFCKAKYDDDTTVTAIRMLEFFQQVVFFRKVRNTVDPDAGYSGQVSLLSPLSNTALAAAVTTATPTTATTTATTTIAVATATTAPIAQVHDPGTAEDPEDPDEEAQDPELDEGAGSEDEAKELSDTQQQEADELDQSIESTFITSITKKNDVFESGSKDAYGNTIILVPVGFNAVDMACKALIFLWKAQSSQLALLPSTEPHPQKDIPLMKAIEEYEIKLVFDLASASDTQTTACSI
ncbi:hypothetical protein BGZ74_005061 [Mortierella antarctica]|nr:hypothetical protein BGZ74_005061 [Mortierella antarctica]